MFESITYKNASSPGPLIDIGALAEGLIFYGRVAIVGNTATLKDILSRVPPLILLPLLREGRIEFYYLSDQIGVVTTQTSEGQSCHDLIGLSSPDHTIEKVGSRLFRDAAGSSGQARVGASQFAKLLRPLDHGGFDQQSVLEALSDNISTEASVESLIQIVVPEYKLPETIRFRIERQNKGFYVDTNIDFAMLNKSYHKVVPSTHSTVTEAYILERLQGAYEATYFAGTLNSEIAVSPIEQIVQAKAVEGIVRRHIQSKTQIEGFVELTLANAHVIREAVNSGAVSFASVVKLLDSADKFRHWIRDQPVDATLLQAYYQETIKDSWAVKLPTKSVRWGIFTGLGVFVDAIGPGGGLGTAAAGAVNAIDAFFVDKLIGGWKPHQFVEGNLKPLFDESQRKS